MVVVLLLVIGALGDHWRAGHPRPVALPEEAGAAPAGAAPAPRPAAEAPVASEPVLDLNTADARALDVLPGIGPVLAERIVEHRRAHGPFRTTDELLAVRGIGPRLFERLKPRVRVGVGPPRAASDGERAR